MKKLALNIWAAFAQKLGLTPQETEDIIFKEIIRRQNLLIKSIDKAKNVIQLENIERTINLYIDAEFCDYPHLIKEPIQILNRHLEWKYNTLNKHNLCYVLPDGTIVTPSAKHDSITERFIDDDIHD